MKEENPELSYGEDRGSFFRDAKDKSPAEIQSMAKQRTTRLKTKSSTTSKGRNGNFYTEAQMDKMDRFIQDPEEKKNIMENSKRIWCAAGKRWQYLVPEYYDHEGEQDVSTFEEEDTAHGDKRLVKKAAAKKAAKDGDAGFKKPILPASILKKGQTKIGELEERAFKVKQAEMLYDDARVKVFVPAPLWEKVTPVADALTQYGDALKEKMEAGDKDGVTKILSDMKETEGEHTTITDKIESAMLGNDRV